METSSNPNYVAKPVRVPYARARAHWKGGKTRQSRNEPSEGLLTKHTTWQLIKLLGTIQSTALHTLTIINNSYT